MLLIFVGMTKHQTLAELEKSPRIVGAPSLTDTKEGLDDISMMLSNIVIRTTLQ